MPRPCGHWSARLVCWLVFVTAVAALVSCNASNSHVDANVPEDTESGRLLKRDLEAFMTQRHRKRCAVRYTLLRKGPTQSGVAWPKFYVWAEVPAGGSTIQEGAVRVAAIDKTRFAVIDHVTVEDIRSDPQGIYKVFPDPVCRRIEERMANMTTDST